MCRFASLAGCQKAKPLRKAKIPYGKNSNEIADWAMELAVAHILFGTVYATVDVNSVIGKI